MIRAIVGAGGKTSLIKQYVKEYLAAGQKVFVTASTHMFIEDDTLLTDDAEEIIRVLDEKHYVMAGIRQGEKIGPLSWETYEKVCQHADMVLIEADGSKHMPLKFPNDCEPVIYENVNEIVVVCGLHALNQKAGEAVQRLELAKKYLPITENTRITPFWIHELVLHGYMEPLRKKYPEKTIKLKANHRHSYYEQAVAAILENEADLLHHKVGCVIMASGLGKRYGSNKLLEQFRGKTLIQHVLDLTGDHLFEKRVVVTRSPEVAKICEGQGVEVILHGLPFRNDTIRLGIEAMGDMEGCLFCPCDQPLLRRESLERMVYCYLYKRISGCQNIMRLGYLGKEGAPVLFPREYFSELAALPEHCGGSVLLKNHASNVYVMQADCEWELFDIDTKEDLHYLEQVIEPLT